MKFFRFPGKVHRVFHPGSSPVAGLSVRLWYFLSAALLALSLNTTNAQAPAGPHRPTTVPEEYLITPFGYFHPSCVTHLAQGDVILKDELAVRHADGSLDSLHACSYPHYNSRGEVSTETPAQEKPPSIGHSWIEDYSITTSSSYGYVDANWVVPPAPSSNDGQTVYFFPGLEDYSDTISILQPVLGWNADYSDAWGIASWNCCVSGTTYESSPVTVNSGDAIYGTMQSTCSAGTLSCGSWNVVTDDATSNSSTTLSQTSSEGQTFNWAFAGALEVYSVSQCSDYPSNGSILFSGITVYDYNFNQVSNPSWSLDNWYSDLTPQCNYGGGESPTQVMLQYGQPQGQQAAAPYQSNLTLQLNGTPPSSIIYTFVLNDATPGATIHYQVTICNSPYAWSTVAPGTQVSIYNSCPDTEPYGYMYATATGYEQSTELSLDL